MNKDYIVELKCEDKENRKYERTLEMNDYETAVKTFYTIVNGIKNDIIGNCEVTLIGHGLNYVFKKDNA